MPLIPAEKAGPADISNDAAYESAGTIPDFTTFPPLVADAPDLRPPMLPFCDGTGTAQAGAGNRAIQWRAISSRRQIHTRGWPRMYWMKRISACARPG